MRPFDHNTRTKLSRNSFIYEYRAHLHTEKDMYTLSLDELCNMSGILNGSDDTQNTV